MENIKKYTAKGQRKSKITLAIIKSHGILKSRKVRRD